MIIIFKNRFIWNLLKPTIENLRVGIVESGLVAMDATRWLPFSPASPCFALLSNLCVGIYMRIKSVPVPISRAPCGGV